MSDIKTGWFPPDILPVNPGRYEVVVLQNPFTEVEEQACWEMRLGQWGFWKTEQTKGRKVSQLLTVVRWRGRELPVRRKLLSEEPPVRMMRRTLLLKVES